MQVNVGSMQAQLIYSLLKSLILFKIMQERQEKHGANCTKKQIQGFYLYLSI